MNKTRVGIICGGRSTEHEISLISARNIITAMDRARFEVVLVAIDKKGRWFLMEPDDFLLEAADAAKVRLKPAHRQLACVPGGEDGRFVLIDQAGVDIWVDVLFPVLHGPYGEDGTIQGLIRMMGLPLVGAGVLGSAVGMDKVVSKSLLAHAGLPTCAFMGFNRAQAQALDPGRVVEELGLPVFVKPANCGSSVGVSRVATAGELEGAVALALRYDHRVIIEAAVEGREIECAVLGDGEPQASVLGEIRPKRGFYSYAAKYLEEDGAELIVPAELAEDTALRIRQLAVAAYLTLGATGMARVDFFLTPSGEPLINEINTIPGFTRISMYPLLWEASGLDYTGLVTRLIEQALAQAEADRSLLTSI